VKRASTSVFFKVRQQSKIHICLFGQHSSNDIFFTNIFHLGFELRHQKSMIDAKFRSNLNEYTSLHKNKQNSSKTDADRKAIVLLLTQTRKVSACVKRYEQGCTLGPGNKLRHDCSVKM